MAERNKILTGAVCVGVAAYIGFGLRGTLAPSAPQVHIEAYNGAVVQTGGTMNISKETIEKILAGTVKKRGVHPQKCHHR